MEMKEKTLLFGETERVAGVVAGLAEYLGMNVKTARALYAAFTVLTGFAIGVILYVVFAFIMVTNEDRHGNSAIMGAK